MPDGVDRVRAEISDVLSRAPVGSAHHAPPLVALTGPVNYAQIPELGERGRDRAQRFFARLDTMIGSQPFVAGDAFSAADIDAFIFCEFSKWIKLEMPAELGNLKRWFEATGERDSAKL